MLPEHSPNTVAQGRAKHDADEFAYVASHDLKAPLRAIKNLAMWIEEDSGSTLNEAGRTHLGKLKARVKHLEALLDGLLALYRAGRPNNAPNRANEEISVHDGEVVNLPDLIERLRTQLPRRKNLELRCAFVPAQITTRSDLLAAVFVQLLTNAILHHDRDHVHIDLSSQMVDGRLQFVVADNGPGIPDQFKTDVFRIFRKLGPPANQDPVGGSGVGLTIANKIVAAESGKIWLEDNSPRGTKVVFTWPASVAVEQAA